MPNGAGASGRARGCPCRASARVDGGSRPGRGLPPLALKPDEVWTYDYLIDRTEAGQILKILIVLDEHTRERLAIRVERHLGAGKGQRDLGVVADAAGSTGVHDERQRPQFIPQALHAWLAAAAKETRTVVHRARASVGERLRGELHREVSR